jgi:hypothetical protein
MVVAAAAGSAAADDVPLPRPRPAQAPTAAPDAAPAAPVAVPPEPSACRIRLTEELATAPSLPPIEGPGECGGTDMVRLEAIVLKDNARVAVTPPATLRCSMAEAVVMWMREEVAPLALELGAALRAVQNFDSFDCRGRNRIVGAKISEHGKGNALDIRLVRLASGKPVEPTDPLVSRVFREKLRQSACARFTTVLGPGSDGYHENHIHVDLAERSNGYRMCKWDVRDPEEKPPEGEVASTGSVPLPPPRPKVEPVSPLRGGL